MRGMRVCSLRDRTRMDGQTVGWTDGRERSTPDAVPVDCEERSDGWCILTMPRPQKEIIEFDLTWDDYVSSPDPWERMLLQRIHFLHQSPFDIHQQLSDAPSATLVSDGGAGHFQGSAGWVIAVGNRRIIQGQCPVPGFDPRS
jgi:hypothetical protein